MDRLPKYVTTREEIAAWVAAKGYTREAYKRAILEGAKRAECVSLADSGRIEIHQCERSEGESLEDFVEAARNMRPGAVVALSGASHTLAFIVPDGSLVTVFDRREL